MRLVVALFATALIVPLALPSNLPPEEVAKHHGAITGDLAEVLGAVAVQLQVPMVAELALPLPHGFNIPEGIDTPERLVRRIIAACPDYAWQRVGRVYYINNRQLVKAPANFLNLQLESFVMPNNVAELSVTLRNALWQCSIPKRIAKQQTCPVPQGYVFAGIWPSELNSLNLIPRKAGNATARQSLLEAATENGQFYSIVVFPCADAAKPEDAEFGLNHWAWHPLSDRAKPFASAFSWYGRVFRVQPDLLLQNLITRVAISHRLSNSKLSITVDERGRVEKVSVLDGHVSESAIRHVRSWRFNPYYLNGLPAKLICELPVEIGRNGSVRPVLRKLNSNVVRRPSSTRD